jgi:RND family efflux transporter MFP subunit
MPFLRRAQARVEERMNKLKWIGGGVLLLAVASGAAYLLLGADEAMPSGTVLAATQASPGSGREPGGAAAAPLEFTAAEVVHPESARLATVLAFSGPLVAPQTAVLRARAGGTLLALDVAEGDRVRAGQVLGRIDMAEASGRVAERSAQLAAARSALAQAQRTHASNEGLAAQGFIAGIALANSRSAVASAQAALDAAQAALDTTRVALRDATLVAPIAGIVARRHVLPGEKVSAEQQVLTLVDLARLELAAQVGTHEVSRLTPGLPVQVRVEGLAEPVTGTLARIAPAAEAGTRSIGVTIALANPGERLRAGQYAMAQVALADGPETLVLPASAVRSSGGESYVWVIDQGALARRSVITGRRDEAGGRIEVLSGLPPQAQVLGVRFDNLREGALAKVLPAKSAVNLAARDEAPATLTR